MINVNSSMDEIMDEMAVTSISNVQLETPGKLLLVEKCSRKKIFYLVIVCICLFIIYIAMISSFVAVLDKGYGISDLGWTIIFFIGFGGLLIIAKISDSIIKKVKDKCNTVIEVYEQGLIIRRRDGTVIHTIGTKTIIDVFLKGRKVTIIQGYQDKYTDINEYTELKNPRRLYSAVMSLNRE